MLLERQLSPADFVPRNPDGQAGPSTAATPAPEAVIHSRLHPFFHSFICSLALPYTKPLPCAGPSTRPWGCRKEPHRQILPSAIPASRQVSDPLIPSPATTQNQPGVPPHTLQSSPLSSPLLSSLWQTSPRKSPSWLWHPAAFLRTFSRAAFPRRHRGGGLRGDRDGSTRANCFWR